jgi:hypothetical protein
MARDAILQLRVDDREKLRWQRIAGANDRPLSDWVREACARHMLSAGSDQTDEILVRIRRVANRLGVATTPGEVAEVVSELRHLIEEHLA